MPFQPSLLADGHAAPTAHLATAQRRDLGQGAWIDHLPGWLGGADALFTSLLHDTPWQRHLPAHLAALRPQGGPGRAPHERHVPAASPPP